MQWGTCSLELDELAAFALPCCPFKPVALKIYQFLAEVEQIAILKVIENIVLLLTEPEQPQRKALPVGKAADLRL